MGPLYIIASERSGTNLLRKRLTENQKCYYGASPGHFLKHLFYQEPYYGDLSNDTLFLLMIEDALQLVRVHFSPWDYNKTADDVLHGYGQRERSSVHLSHYLLEDYARSKGYLSYICKDNYLYEFGLDISHKFVGAKFIYLFRDPRDFVLSQMKRPGSIKDAFYYAKLWEYEQIKSIRVANELLRSGRCIWISYEDFIKNENDTIDKLLHFIGVERDCPEKPIQDTIVEAVSDWENLRKPTLRDNSGKYKNELTRGNLQIVEAVCVKQMTFLGYKLETQPIEITSKIQFKARIVVLLKQIFKRMQSTMKKDKSIKDIVRKRAELLKRFDLNYRYLGE